MCLCQIRKRCCKHKQKQKKQTQRPPSCFRLYEGNYSFCPCVRLMLMLWASSLPLPLPYIAVLLLILQWKACLKRQLLHGGAHDREFLGPCLKWKIFFCGANRRAWVLLLCNDAGGGLSALSFWLTQRDALIIQYGEASVWDFPVITSHPRLLSS